MREKIAALACVLVSACSSDREVDRAACERLRDHLIDVRFEGTGEHRAAHRRAARDTMGDDFLRRCVAETSLEKLDCAMSAMTVDSLRTCTTVKEMP